jgi:hypothetical protein
VGYLHFHVTRLFIIKIFEQCVKFSVSEIYIQLSKVCMNIVSQSSSEHKKVCDRWSYSPASYSEKKNVLGEGGVKAEGKGSSTPNMGKQLHNGKY